MLADRAVVSTRESALPYKPAMRGSAIILPLLFILADGVACKDDEPNGGEFGDPCGYDPETGEDRPCGDGLECFIGYCEETCESNDDCRPIEGYRHECDLGVCHIYCEGEMQICPQTLGTPLECVMLWCSGES